MENKQSEKSVTYLEDVQQIVFECQKQLINMENPTEEDQYKLLCEIRMKLYDYHTHVHFGRTFK